MSYNLESEISKVFGKLLENETDYNVIIHIGRESDFKEFHAHYTILRCRSEYFYQILSAKDIEKKNGKYIIKKPNIVPQAFDVIIKYLYTGHINITNKTGIELLKIIIASNEINLRKLSKLTEDFIIENPQLFQNDSIEFLQIVHSHQYLNSLLLEFCLEIICSEPRFLFIPDKFTQLSAPLLEIILKRDDLNSDEVIIWENLIKWGLAQDQEINKDVSKWSRDDINVFERVLHKFIPLIRFYEMTRKDYLEKVKPYEKILPKDLKDDFLKFLMISEHTPTYNKHTRRYSKYDVDSIIINQKHLILFSNWIDKKKEDTKYDKNIPYRFDLIYRASRDGYTSAAFHEKCDNKKATIVVAKIENSEHIVGGYNPLEWNSNDKFEFTESSLNSFIFSHRNRNYTKSAKVGYCKVLEYSIYCCRKYGPAFGGGCDLNCKSDGTWQSNSLSYPNIDIPRDFNVDDYEVFQVIGKVENPRNERPGIFRRLLSTKKRK